jgi:DNA-binding PadR family transcriptional regulator
VKIPRSDIMRKILLTIDQHPSSIYDIQYSIAELSDPKRTRLPKLLRSMEEEYLVTSALQPGPLGPYRRMYQLGPKAEEYLNESLRDAIETILRFYSNYRRENPAIFYHPRKEPEKPQLSGYILFAAFPSLTVEDLKEIRDLLTSTNRVSVAIVGPDDILSKTGIDYLNMGDDITSINTQNKEITEIRFRGVPSKDNLSSAISECKRVLARNGMLKISVPFLFDNELKGSKLVTFLESTINDLFPEMGIGMSKSLQENLENYFSRTGIYETQYGNIVFWGIKS